MYQGLRPELEKLAEVVSKRIESVTTPAEIAEVIKLNAQIPH
jgi:hypothetical protein